MAWTGGPGAGFTKGRPWLRIGEDAAYRNVEAQAADPSSVLACYRRLLRARRQTPALRSGAFHWLAVDDPDVLGWGRGSLAVLPIVADTSWKPAGDGSWQVLTGTSTEPSKPTGDGEITLRGLEAVVLVRSGGSSALLG